MEATEKKEWTVLTVSMRRALALNLTAALAVAGEAQESDHVKKMTLTDLSKKTGIARSTLSKLKKGNTTSGIQANPDMETICRLANALNLPPALLLMSMKDWQGLRNAFDGVAHNVSKSYLELETLKLLKGIEKVEVGLRVAIDAGTYPCRPPLMDEGDFARKEEMKREFAHRNKMKRLAILTTTAVTQGWSTSTKIGEIDVLTVVGGIFGSNFE